ncbi:MAG: AAA family ATPase [Planctomycetes bacterium]|nr:AAA family ATPase [Planctomycetota bacterium]
MSEADDAQRLARERALIEDLSDPNNLPGSPRQIELARTHGSLVFLADDDVYKLKRAVDFGFFDFTTLAARRADCDAELRPNRRTAADVYLDVLPIYADDDGFSMTRAHGEPVEWAVHMRRLPDDVRADVLLRTGRLDAGRVAELAAATARFHREAEPHDSTFDALRTNIAENFEQTRPMIGRHLDQATFDDLHAAQHAWLEKSSVRLASRPACDGHGDLRLEHVYFLDGGPVMIDCIEFNERFRIADPALDVAFLAMEAYREGRGDLAEVFLGAFAYESDDYEFYPIIDGYMSYRAFVRAKVAGFVADDPGTSAEVRTRKRDAAERQFELALDLLAPRDSARIVAIGGLPGSGKSTVARAVRALLFGPIISADATRKHLAGVDKLAAAGADAYTPEFSARVLDEIVQRTDCVLASGRTAIVDTTFYSGDALERVAKLAADWQVPIDFIECTAPVDVLRRRLRQREGDVSDADTRVLDKFLARRDRVALDAPVVHHLLDTDCDPNIVRESLVEWLLG